MKKLQFNINQVGKTNRGNNKVGVKLTNYFKAYVYNDDGLTVDLVPQTTAKSTKSSRKRSRFTTIDLATFDSMRAICSWVEGEDTEETDSNGDVMHFFINEEGDREPKLQSEFYGAVIDGNTLSATCELGIFRHYYAGLQSAVYAKRDKSGFAVNGELITRNGVRGVYAIDKDGSIIVEPVYYDDSVNFTNELVNGLSIKDTTFEEMVDHYNSVNNYGLTFVFVDTCFIELEALQSTYEEHEIECKSLDETLDNLAFLENYEYEAFNLEDINEDDEDDNNAVFTPLTMNALSSYKTKSQIKELAKSKGLNIKFAASMKPEAMKEAIIEEVNSSQVPF